MLFDILMGLRRQHHTCCMSDICYTNSQVPTVGTKQSERHEKTFQRRSMRIIRLRSTLHELKKSAETAMSGVRFPSGVGATSECCWIVALYVRQNATQHALRHARHFVTQEYNRATFPIWQIVAFGACVCGKGHNSKTQSHWREKRKLSWTVGLFTVQSCKESAFCFNASGWQAIRNFEDVAHGTQRKK